MSSQVTARSATRLTFGTVTLTVAPDSNRTWKIERLPI